MKVYHGISASIGIAIGEAFIYDQHLHIPNYSISERQVEFEVHRFFIAMAKTKEEYIQIQKKLVQEMSEDQARMLDAHIMMVDDAFLIKSVRHFAVKNAISNLSFMMSSMNNAKSSPSPASHFFMNE